ncbi:MAG TPA: hypothetical protein VN281_05945, partial [Verrucomicrobiae bacterium]|nr:hypothetical protein [Verrucomicrobiae bacterium]
LGLTQFYGAAFDPSNPANILGGAQDQASPRSYGAASPRAPAAASLANWNNGVGGDGGNCAINPVLPLVQFGEVGGFRQDSVGRPLASLFGTTNGWASSNALINGFPTSSFTPPFALDGTGATSNTVFYGTITNIIYYASDYMHRIAWDGVNVIVDTQLGATQLTGGGNGVGSPGFLSFSTQPAFVNAVALAPGDNNRLYAGSTDGTLWMTRHARATNTAMAVHWEQINTGNPALPVLAVNCIAVDPYNQNRVFVGFAGSGDGLSHVWVCQDVSQLTANRVWTPAATNGLLNVPVNGIALDPANPTNTWYIATDNGVYFTRNGGAAWLDGSHAYGLPAVQVNNLQSMPGTGKLNAATYGRGVWNLTLNNGIQQIAGFGITPNPIASNALNLAVGRITLSKPAPTGGVSIQITNDHPSTYNFTNQFIPAGQISTFFFVLGLDQQPGSNITFTAILGSESHNTVLQVVDPASGRALFSENTIVASLSLDGTGNAKVSFLSEPGITYVLEYKNSLSDPAWTPLPPGAAGTGGVLVLQDTTGPQPRRFYRVVGSPGL